MLCIFCALWVLELFSFGLLAHMLEDAAHVFRLFLFPGVQFFGPPEMLREVVGTVYCLSCVCCMFSVFVGIFLVHPKMPINVTASLL